MTGTDREQLDRRRRWAAAELGVSPGAPAEEVRAAFLRRLLDEDFMPPPSWRWAVEALSRQESGGPWEARADEEASRAEEERLREEVEAFAEQFWTLAPPERDGRWQELAARCAFSPPLRARLEHLRPGLDLGAVPRDGEEPPQVVELAGHIRELFVLRPGPRARARRTLLAGMRGRMAEWNAATKRLRKRYRALAALEPHLVEELAAWTWQRDYVPNVRPPRPRQEKAGKWTWRSLGCNPVFVVVIVVMNLFRVLFSSGDRPRYDPTPPATTPRFGDDGFIQPGGKPTPFGISPETLERVRRLPKEKIHEQVEKLIEELRESEKAKRGKAGNGPGSGQPPTVQPSRNPPALPAPDEAGEKTFRGNTERRSP